MRRTSAQAKTIILFIIFVIIGVAVVFAVGEALDKPRGGMLNKAEEIVLAAGDGPYEYFCPIGKHYWKLTALNGIIPPAMDGATVVCPEHMQPYVEEGT